MVACVGGGGGLTSCHTVSESPTNMYEIDDATIDAITTRGVCDSSEVRRDFCILHL
jgi:hypothetical protein